MTTIEMTTPWERISAHWSTRVWLHTAHLVTGVPIALLGAGVISALVAASVLLVWTVVVPVVALLLFFVVVRLLTRVQRSRFAAFLDVDILPVARRPLSMNPFRRLLQEARTLSTWRRLGYHLLAPLISGIGAFSVVGAWAGGIVTAALSVRYWAMEESGRCAHRARRRLHHPGGVGRDHHGPPDHRDHDALLGAHRTGNRRGEREPRQHLGRTGGGEAAGPGADAPMDPGPARGHRGVGRADAQARRPLLRR